MTNPPDPDANKAPAAAIALEGGARRPGQGTASAHSTRTAEPRRVRPIGASPSDAVAVLRTAAAALDRECAPWDLTAAEHPECSWLLEQDGFPATWPGAHDFNDRMRGAESVCLVDRCARLAGPLAEAGVLCFGLNVPPPFSSVTEYMTARVAIAGRLDEWEQRQLRRQLWLTIASAAVVVVEPKGVRHAV